jgi:hypothetical protein
MNGQIWVFNFDSLVLFLNEWRTKIHDKNQKLKCEIREFRDDKIKQIGTCANYLDDILQMHVKFLIFIKFHKGRYILKLLRNIMFKCWQNVIFLFIIYDVR